MRLDKYLKVSRLLKRRTLAHDACEGHLVKVNGKTAKPAHNLKIDDIIEISFASKPLKAKVKSLNPKASKAEAASLYEIIEE